MRILGLFRRLFSKRHLWSSSFSRTTFGFCGLVVSYYFLVILLNGFMCHWMIILGCLDWPVITVIVIQRVLNLSFEVSTFNEWLRVTIIGLSIDVSCQVVIWSLKASLLKALWLISFILYFINFVFLVIAFSFTWSPFVMNSLINHVSDISINILSQCSTSYFHLIFDLF